MEPTIVLKILERLKNDRFTWENHWQEIADLGHVKRATFNVTRVRGDKRTRKQYDTTGQYSAEILANGLHGMMMSPSTRWFFLVNDRSRLSRNSIEWLQATENVLYNIFNDSKTNFHSQIHELLLDVISFGTGIFQATKQGQLGIYYQTRHLNECFILENSMGVSDGIIRIFKYNSSDLYQRWPDTIPPEVKEDLQGGKSKEYEIVHAVIPRENYIPGKLDTLNMPWSSIYILKKTKTVLHEGGFKSFPFMIPRWTKRTGEIYGGSPMQNALPNMKTANQMMKEILEAAQKLNRPPLQLPDQGFVGPVRTMAGGLNYYRQGSQDRIEALDTRARPEIGVDMLERIQKSIMQSFYVDAFMMTDDSNGVNVKAQFVRQRREERFRQLSPLLMRFQTEFMNPLIMRTYDMAVDLGMIEEAPDELAEMGLNLGYVSPIQRAQKQEDGENLIRLMEIVAPIGETDPSVWDNFNGDAIVEYGANELYNIPQVLLKPKEEIAAIREQRAEQQQMESMIQQLQGGAAGLKDASVARKNALPTQG